MSGLGKSHWSAVLKHCGFNRLCCDDEIRNRLLASVKYSNHREFDLGEWMGLPYEPGYRSKERIYLSLEIEVLNEFVAHLSNSSNMEKIAIDTTGSAPYAGDEVMGQLSELSCIIYLAASEEYHSEMLERYIKCPRPVLWGDKFRQIDSESTGEALARSYEELLNFRDTLYKKYAHYTIPYEMHRR
jgi:shikimate kinase